jgi:hypothetical protein
MKLAGHVQHIKDVTYKSFDNLFARLGIRGKQLAGEELIPDHQLSKRAKILELIDNHKEEKDDYPAARERALEELTFTLFNRIAAVKVMEAKTLFPEIITKRPENGDRSFQHKAWLEQHPDMRSEELEGLREFIKHAFDNLGEELALYHKSYPYALLPNTLDLNEIIEAFNAVEKDKKIDDRIWASDDILGWLYESYNNDKKIAFKEDGGKTEYDKVSLQSQVYTPRWVVEFLVNNSLGKLYLEMYPTSNIKNRKKIANAPQKQLREPKPLHEVTLIDPAPGSGNFLLYAFDLFYELYMDQIEFFGADYNEDEIPKLIIEHNLFGIDLDDRAIQLAQLGLYVKAKSINRNTSVSSFHVVSSDFYLPDFETVRPLFEDDNVLESGVTDLLKEIWDDLQNAHKFGSLLKIEDRVNRRLEKFKEDPMDLFVQEEMAKYGEFEEEFFPRIRKAVQQHANGSTTAFVKEKTLDALTYLEIITQEYDVAVANPPYTDSSDFGADLKKFIEDNYKKPHKFHTNLYASFIKRCTEITNELGYVGMIHPHTFMFIKSYEDVRKYLIDKTHIQSLVDYGLDRVNLFGPGILLDASFYTFCKRKSDEAGVYLKITSNQQEKFKKGSFHEALNKVIDGEKYERVYHLLQSKLKLIKGWPFIYWISDGFREKFKAEPLDDVLIIRQGGATGNNERTLRFWWEIDREKISEERGDNRDYLIYQKGGPYLKWFGSNWLTVAYNNKKMYEYLKNHGNKLPSEEHYLKEGVTYCSSGSKGTSFRYMPENQIISGAGPGIYPTDIYSNIGYYLGFLNSKMSFYLTKCLNPTVNTTQGDLKRIPFTRPNKERESIVSKLTWENVSLGKEITSQPVIELNYSGALSDIAQANNLNDGCRTIILNDVFHNTLQLINESIINDKVFEVYELSENDKDQVVESEGRSIGEYPLLPAALTGFKNAIKDSEFVTEELWEKLEQIEQDEQVIQRKEKLEKEFPKLYQSNYGFEEFCIKNEVNPINAWYWFKEGGIVPQQRAHDIALEFLADLLRDVLMEDEDGMIPLVRNAGEEILIDRLERNMREKGFSTAQVSQLDGLLGKPLNEYLQEHFFEELSDHLNLFMYLPKTPFIWHLSSGPNKGFECYLVIYKWSRDNLLSLKSVYIEKRERALKNRLTDVGDRSDAASQNERDTIQKQLEEIEEFKEKIDDLIASGYDPILDDGVGKNIAPLQKRGMIPYDVLTKSQLKKYLNADW